MTDQDRITDQSLWAEARELAREIFDECRDSAGADFDPEEYRGAMGDRAHEYADGHQWVSYTYKAIQLCSECDTTRGEEFMDDCGGVERGDTFGGIATKIAYGELRQRIEEEISDLIEAWESDEAA